MAETRVLGSDSRTRADVIEILLVLLFIYLGRFRYDREFPTLGFRKLGFISPSSSAPNIVNFTSLLTLFT